MRQTIQQVYIIMPLNFVRDNNTLYRVTDIDNDEIGLSGLENDCLLTNS